MYIYNCIIYIFLVSGAEHLANTFQLWRLLQRSSLSLLYSWNTFLFWFEDWYDMIGYNMTWNDPIWFNLIRSNPIWYDPSIWSDMWFLFTSLSDLQSQERSSALGLGRLRLGRDRGGVGFATLHDISWHTNTSQCWPTLRFFWSPSFEPVKCWTIRYCNKELRSRKGAISNLCQRKVMENTVIFPTTLGGALHGFASSRECIDSASNTVCYVFLRHWKKALVGAYFQPQTLPISIIPLDPSRADFDFLTFSPHTHTALAQWYHARHGRTEVRWWSAAQPCICRPRDLRLVPGVIDDPNFIRIEHTYIYIYV